MLTTIGICIRWLRRRYYDIFVPSHFSFAGGASLALWKHLAVQRAGARLLILGGLVMWAIFLLLDNLLCAWRNIVWSKQLGNTTVEKFEDIIRLKVRVPRRWQVRAGHHVFLSMPGLNLKSILQSHPFMIAWWEEAGEELILYSLVQPRKSGLTRDLETSRATSHFTIISGPYGSLTNYQDYGAVLMFASGIGIAAQVPHIKELFDRFTQGTARTRRIHLVWKTKKEGQSHPALSYSCFANSA
jgi:predicted ferric reductase